MATGQEKRYEAQPVEPPDRGRGFVPVRDPGGRRRPGVQEGAVRRSDGAPWRAGARSTPVRSCPTARSAAARSSPTICPDLVEEASRADVGPAVLRRASHGQAPRHRHRLRLRQFAHRHGEAEDERRRCRRAGQRHLPAERRAGGAPHGRRAAGPQVRHLARRRGGPGAAFSNEIRSIQSEVRVGQRRGSRVCARPTKSTSRTAVVASVRGKDSVWAARLISDWSHLGQPSRADLLWRQPLSRPRSGAQPGSGPSFR